jgi:hypothetical protein
MYVAFRPSSRKRKELSISGKIVQINYKFSVSAAQLGQSLVALAGDIAGVKGLRWKIWLINAAPSVGCCTSGALAI